MSKTFGFDIDNLSFDVENRLFLISKTLVWMLTTFDFDIEHLSADVENIWFWDRKH